MANGNCAATSTNNQTATVSWCIPERSASGAKMNASAANIVDLHYERKFTAEYYKLSTTIVKRYQRSMIATSFPD